MPDRLQFLRAFLRSPGTVGALVPSSAVVARTVVRAANVPASRTIVELGPGTGAITGEIDRRRSPDSVFLAIELDAGCAERLAVRYPGVRVHRDTAVNLGTRLRESGRPRADCIISAIPFGNVGRDREDELLDAIFTALAPGGTFVALSYAHAWFFPGIRHFRTRVRRHFARVSTSGVVWRNLPPAVIYRCQ